MIGVHTGGHLEAHEARLGEREVEGAARLRGTDGRPQILAAAEEIALGQRKLAQDTIGGGVTGGRAIFTGGLFLDIDIEDDLVRRRTGGRGNIDPGEIAKSVDIVAAPDHHGAVERVAFSKIKLTTNDEVARLDVAGDVDALDIDARTFVDQIGDVEGIGRCVAIQASPDVGEGVALNGGLIGHVFDGLLQLERGIGCALPGAYGAAQSIGIQSINAGFDTDIAELILLTFIDGHVDEVRIARGVIFGNRIDLRVGETTIGVVSPDALAIDGHLLLVIGIVAEQPAQNARLLGEHGPLEVARTNGVVAGEVDRGDTGALAFIDLEDNPHATVCGLLGARRHRNGIESIPIIGQANAFDIRVETLLAVNSRGRDIDHGQELTVGEAAIAFEQH